MAKVLILNPPSPDKFYINRDLMGGMGVKNNFKSTFFNEFITKLKNKFVRIPVVQLVYAATVLKKDGFELLVIDAANESKSLAGITPEIAEFQPDYAVMACSASCFIYERDAVAKKIKELCPKVKIIVEGEMISERPDYMLPYYDIAILGEVENSIARICKNEPLENIPDLAYNSNGAVKKTPKANRLEK